jgi:proton-dependent oligopeptide transporter, POT family
MAEHKYLTAPDPDEKGWPGGIKYIIGNEGCERFSYYGMRAILFLYIVSLFANFRHFDEEDLKTALADKEVIAAATKEVDDDILKAATLNADEQIRAAAELEADDQIKAGSKADRQTLIDELVAKDSEAPRDTLIASIVKKTTAEAREKQVHDKIVIKATEKVTEAEATESYHLFGAAVYAFPMLGAILADRLLGKYRTILWLSVVYCIGHAFLALFENSALQMDLFGAVYIDEIYGLYLGLGLIAIGSGGIKPCVSAHVGDQFGKGNWHLIQKVYNAFYFIINFGSAFATIIIPRVRGIETKEVIINQAGVSELQITYGGSVTWAFAIPGILMGLATIFFYMGRKEFVHVPPTHPGRRGLLDFLSGTSLFMVVGIPIFFHDNFSSAQLLMACGGCLALFVLLFYVRQAIEQDDGFLAILFYCIFQRNSAPVLNDAYEDPPSDEESSSEDHALKGHWFWDPAVRRFGGLATEGPVAVLKIMSVFVFIAVFWALFDQHGSTWIAQAKNMDRRIDFSFAQWMIIGITVGLLLAGAFVLTLSKSKNQTIVMLGAGAIGGVVLGFIPYMFIPAGFEVQPSEVPALNPFMVMILIPYTTFGLYPLMKHCGLDPKPLTRMTIGMFIASLAFVSVAFVQQFMDADSAVKIHVGWQLFPYTIITIAEVMVSITGLEFAYRQAPKRMKSVIMGFWLFMVTLGNVIVALLAKLPDMNPLSFFWLYAGLMAVAAVAFGLRAMFYTYRDYTQ